MRYRPILRTSDPVFFVGKVQPGQWIDYNGARGRVMGFRRGCAWIAWGSTATKRFSAFAQAFKA